MRKLLALLLTLCMILCALPAVAEETDVTAMMRQKAEEAVAELQSKATGWAAGILEGAQVTDVRVSESGKSVTATVTLPTFSAGVDQKTPVTEPAAYMQQAVASGKTAERKLTAAVNADADGSVSLKWSGDENPTKLLSSAKKLAAAARSSFNIRGVKTALEEMLLPKAADLPKKKPQEAPALCELTDYCAQAAQTLRVSESSAARRLTPLMLLMSIAKAEAGDEAMTLNVSIRVGEWEKMLEDAEAQAKTAMEDMLGAPDFSRDDLDRVLGEQLAAAFLPYAYSTKTPSVLRMTVDLNALASDGPASATALMDFFREYMQAADEAVDRLAAYAATLPYYPDVPLIDTTLLTGASDAEGSRVIFDTKGTQLHGYVLVERNGVKVLSGFIHQGVRLQTRLTPGSYRVYFTVGETWYGERYFFGADARCGYFDCTVGTQDNTWVHLNVTEDGETAVTDVTWDELRREAGVW